jgi:3-methyl-2-oxobutanoate hydroxymethyltransferase
MEKVSIPKLIEAKKKGEKIALLTCYDYAMAKIEDSVGIDVILVGDSVGMTILGYTSTLPVTIDEMLIFTKAVRKGVQRALVVIDMPFMSYQLSPQDALRNASRFVAEADVDAVKLEGGTEIKDTVKKIVDAGVPVMGHIGLTPQSLKKFGGYKVRGKTSADKEKLIDDAKALEDSGVFSIIVECVVKEVTPEIRDAVSVPIYGIGAGPDCDGQIIVVNDILGLDKDWKLRKFEKQYADLSSITEGALKNYVTDVKAGKFPDASHSYSVEK